MLKRLFEREFVVRGRVSREQALEVGPDTQVKLDPKGFNGNRSASGVLQCSHRDTWVSLDVSIGTHVIGLLIGYRIRLSYEPPVR